MAAAPKAQGPPRLVPVHEDVQPYTYSSSYIALGGGLDLGAGSSAAGGKGAGSSAPPTLVVIEERRQSSAQEPAAERPLLEDALDDFISLDVEPAVPQVVGAASMPSIAWFIQCGCGKHKRCHCCACSLVQARRCVARRHRRRAAGAWAACRAPRALLDTRSVCNAVAQANMSASLRLRRRSLLAPCAAPAQRGEQPPAAAAAAGGGGSGGVADALLGDYVALGILDDPAAAAAEKAAATVRQSARPELLPSVPWMAALKGIRSPLLRLHQGEPHAQPRAQQYGCPLANAGEHRAPPPRGPYQRPGSAPQMVQRPACRWVCRAAPPCRAGAGLRCAPSLRCGRQDSRVFSQGPRALPVSHSFPTSLFPPPAEVVEFCRYLAPSPAESAARQAAIDAIEDVVTSIWPKARLQVFGSFATGGPPAEGRAGGTGWAMAWMRLADVPQPRLHCVPCRRPPPPHPHTHPHTPHPQRLAPWLPSPPPRPAPHTHTLPTCPAGASWLLACRTDPAPAPASTLQNLAPLAGLYLPTSDVDAVIMGSGCTDVPQVHCGAASRAPPGSGARMPAGGCAAAGPFLGRAARWSACSQARVAPSSRAVPPARQLPLRRPGPWDETDGSLCTQHPTIASLRLPSSGCRGSRRWPQR